MRASPDYRPKVGVFVNKEKRRLAPLYIGVARRPDRVVRRTGLCEHPSAFPERPPPTAGSDDLGGAPWSECDSAGRVALLRPESGRRTCATMTVGTVHGIVVLSRLPASTC